MRKKDELVSGCMSRAGDEEMTFVLLSRDSAAPRAIREWAALRVDLGKNHPNDAQIIEAEQCAATMEREGALHKPDRRAAEDAADTGRAQDQRVEFEAWIAQSPFEKSVKRWPQNDLIAWPGHYEDIDVQLAWEAWQQARRAQEPQRLPGVTAAELAEFIRCAPNAYVRAEAQRESAGDRHGEAFYAPLPSAAKIAAALAQEPQPAGALEWREHLDGSHSLEGMGFDFSVRFSDGEWQTGSWQCVPFRTLLAGATDLESAKAQAVDGLRAFCRTLGSALSGDGTRQGEEGASDE